MFKLALVLTSLANLAELAIRRIRTVRPTPGRQLEPK